MVSLSLQMVLLQSRTPLVCKNLLEISSKTTAAQEFGGLCACGDFVLVWAMEVFLEDALILK